MKKNIVKISREELKILYLPKRLSALDITKLIRLPLKSNFTDKIDLSLTPYLEMPISLIGKNNVKVMGIIAPTQSGKTVVLQIVVADSIEQDPGTLIYINPDETLSKKGMREKIINMILETPELKKHIKSLRNVSKIGVQLDNMSIYPAWAGSLATMSSIPAKRVILDEVRLMKLMIGEESNAIKLAADRLTTYYNMGLGQLYLVSTPSVEGDLLHQQLSVPGTLVLHWHVKCKHCGKASKLDFFKNVKVIDNKVRCICLECGNYFEDKDQKREMNSTGFYAPSGSLELPEKLPERVFFWYDSLVSPFRSFEAIYNEYLSTKDKLHDYKNFWQCWLSRFWIDDISKTTEKKLKDRCVEDMVGVVPSWCKLITAGIDTQGDGFFVVVRAWGQDRLTRVIDAYFIECKLKISDSNDIKEILKRDVINRIYTTESNIKWKVGLTSIDTGGNRTKQVYEGTRDFERFIWCKGVGEKQNVTIQYSKEYNLYLVKTSEYLDETEIKSEKSFWELAKNLSDDYFRQFVNYRKTRKKNKVTGEDKIFWRKIGQVDYRMADVHSFICLDIPTDMGTFRNELNKPEFSYNPLKVFENIKNEEVYNRINEEEEDYEKDDGDYEIGNFTWN
jgi:phage terminase large subunit GpA-like protein